MIGIYKITNPKGAIYIGQSINLEKRKITYSKAKCKAQRKIYNSIVKYGWDNHRFEIIYECTREELNYYERNFGELYDVLSVNNLNLLLPTGDEDTTMVSDETRLKMSKSQSGKNNPMFGKNHNKESKLKIARRNSKNKRVVNTETGEIYYSISELSRVLNIPRTTLERKLNSGMEKYSLQ